MSRKLGGSRGIQSREPLNGETRPFEEVGDYGVVKVGCVLFPYFVLVVEFLLFLKLVDF